MKTVQPLPFGIADLTQEFVVDPGPPVRVRCYVEGCQEMLQPAARGFHGEPCPIHGICCHCSGSSVTLTFRNHERNLIVSPRLFTRKVRHHPEKVETHRFGFLNSEDAVSWNVFRSLQEAEALYLVAQFITGELIAAEPLLYLWGLSSSDDKFEMWPLLTEARRRFEIDKLPIARPLTEPDIILFVPGRLIILIEAKLLSHNPVVIREQPRKTPQSLTMAELLHLYCDPSLTILDIDQVRLAEVTYPQLHRNLVFAEYLAKLDGPHTRAFLANLVRAGEEHDAAGIFRQFLRPQFADRFARITWEMLFTLAGLHYRRLGRLQEYMLTKAVGTNHGFIPAFQLDAW